MDPIPTVMCRTEEDYLLFKGQDAEAAGHIASIEHMLVRDGVSSFTLPGRCAICDAETRFLVDFAYAPPAEEGRRVPNWRERLECAGCGLNNRMRAALHFLQGNMRVAPGVRLYITEEVTPLFAAFRSRFPRLVGSEYLRDGTSPGSRNAAGVRHEDVTALTFADGSLDAICSFDVLEHVPDYRRALEEFARCLAPGGSLLLTVLFWPDRAKTLTRAVIAPDGTGIVHLEEPEYHGDPLDESGVLCFYHFGWDFLADMEAAGFSNPMLSFFWSLELGYLGGRQFLISAVRS